MGKRLTITLDEQVYEELLRVVGRRHISQFMEGLVRPHVVGTNLEDAYHLMAQDEEREAAALDWIEATVVDSAG